MNFAVSLFGLLLAAPALAGNDNLTAWSNLQSLHAGQKIEVIDMKLKSHRGQFAAAGREELTLHTSAGQLTLARESVLRVSSREHSKRLRNALIGAAIGGGAALVGGGIADYRFSNEGREHIAKTIFVPIGLGVGAAIGASIPGFETIYRAHPDLVRSAQTQR